MSYAEPHIASARPSYQGGRGPRPGRSWRRVLVATTVLTFLGASVGTAFGLAGKAAQDPPADPAALSATTDPTADPSGTGEPPSQSQPPTQPPATATKNPGHQTVAVPHVVGLDEKSARHKIDERHLTAKVTYVCSGHEAPGRVTAQDPRGDTKVDANRTVTVEVQGIEVPHVVGEAHGHAKSQLQSAGLAVTVSHKATSDVEPGQVTGQHPAAGTCVKPGSSIALTVAQAPPAPSTEPSVSS